eukprot:s321_g23.t1
MHIWSNHSDKCKCTLAMHAKEKFSCRKPEGFYHLIAQLRKSSVPLGGLSQATGS